MWTGSPLSDCIRGQATWTPDAQMNPAIIALKKGQNPLDQSTGFTGNCIVIDIELSHDTIAVDQKDTILNQLDEILIADSALRRWRYWKKDT